MTHGEKSKNRDCKTNNNQKSICKTSDVDIAIVRKDINEYAWGSIFSPYTPAFKYNADAAVFKMIVENALKTHFTSSYVHRKNKSIKVDGNTYRKQADTVPAFGMHHFYDSEKDDYQHYNEGITIYADDGQVINNFPTLKTKESGSKSISGSVEEILGEPEFIYTYLNESKAKIRERSSIHYGTATFAIENKKRLTGKYYTDRETAGDLYFVKKE